MDKLNLRAETRCNRSPGWSETKTQPCKNLCIDNILQLFDFSWSVWKFANIMGHLKKSSSTNPTELLHFQFGNCGFNNIIVR